MKNITLNHAREDKGWYLKIEGFGIIDLALTSVELWSIHKVIEDNMDAIMEEIKKDEKDIETSI